MRGFEAKMGEGIQGFFHERKVAGYFPGSGRQPKIEGNRPVFDRRGNLLGEVPPQPMTDRWRLPVEANWIYNRPIFAKSTTTPWSNRVVGLFFVISSEDDADSLFKTEEFQRQVDSIATEVSPYLDAIQVLTSEEKL